jgi:hypothetical protein
MTMTTKKLGMVALLVMALVGCMDGTDEGLGESSEAVTAEVAEDCDFC